MRFLTILLVTGSLYGMEKDLYKGEFKDFCRLYKENKLNEDVAIVWQKTMRWRDIAYWATWDAKIRVWLPNEAIREAMIKIEHNFSLNMQSTLYLAYYHYVTKELSPRIWPLERTLEEKEAEYWYNQY